MNGHDAERTIDHVVGAIDTAVEGQAPFRHLQLAEIFPSDVYAAMLDAMPAAEDYRQMSGRTKYTRTREGGTRVKLDLFPEFIRHLPAQKTIAWQLVGQTLCSSEVREAFRRRLAPDLERRFGAAYRNMGMYPIPILTRDIAGYQIGIHPDTRWKGMTIQLYLPRDRSIEHVGTIFHRRTGEGVYEKAKQMLFSPNTGYAFAVNPDTYHSVDTVGPEVQTRDSILLTYFVDGTPLQRLRNRGRRVGNFVLNEYRNLLR
ncbi:MAG: hypothetical protein ACREU5_08885 [Burkholderiales bacterium]